MKALKHETEKGNEQAYKATICRIMEVPPMEGFAWPKTQGFSHFFKESMLHVIAKETASYLIRYSPLSRSQRSVVVVYVPHIHASPTRYFLHLL